MVEGNPRGRRRILRIADELHVPSAASEHGDSHQVEIQVRAEGFGQLIEVLADRKAGAQRARKPRKRSKPAPPAALPMEEDDVLDERTD